MFELKSANSDWANRFKILVSRASGLKRQEGELSDETRSAAFKLDPRPEWAHNLFVECRWEVFSVDVELAELERDVARIVLQMRANHKALASAVMGLIEPLADKSLNVRVGTAKGTIYITEVTPKLPTLDLHIAPFRQPERIEQYAIACKRLRQFWADNCGELDRLPVSRL